MAMRKLILSDKTMATGIVVGVTVILLLAVTMNGVDRGVSFPDVPNIAWIDVTAPLDPATTPTYPGDTLPKFQFLRSFDHGDKVTLSAYIMTAHAGTHVDAPLHFVANGGSIDEVPLTTLMGQTRVIDCSPDALAVDAAELNRHSWRGAKRILFRTRNSRNSWMTDVKFHENFTYIAPDAAQLMADSAVELVGIDYLSAEKFGAPEAKTHQILLGRNIPIIEGLDLRKIEAGDYDMIVLPLRIVGHEAAPARALLRPVK
jgi:arylformamidase